MKIILFFLCVVCLFCRKQDFEIIEATSQGWSGGVVGNEGTSYDIFIKVNKSSKKLKIDQLWINDRFYNVEIYVKTKKSLKKDTCFKKHNTVLIKAIDSAWPTYKTDINKNILPPYKYEGAGLIGYTLENKRKYQLIKEIRQLPPLVYP